MKSWFKRKSDADSGGPKLRFKAGDYIFKEKDLGQEMFIIQDGLVDVLKLYAGEEKQMERLEPGDFFGEMSILEKLPRPGSARAVTDCNLLRIDDSTFEDMLTDNPAIAIRMLRKMSRRLSKMQKDSETSLREAASAPVSDTEKLIHDESGTEFALSASANTTIGRSDPLIGPKPDIDLSAIDAEGTVSYRQANIVRHGAKLLFYGEVGADNNFINDQPVKPGLAFELKSGDELRFGDVRTVLRLE